MSRTIRVNLVYSRGRMTEKTICSDGKQRWKCKCSYCLSNSRIRTNKELERTNPVNDISVPDKIEAEEHYEKNSYEYWDDFLDDYRQHESFIG